MPNNQKFLAEYARLNPLQQAAVDHIEKGPLLLLAGPGTGKTQVLAMRIANILLKTDSRAENILALTFTEAAAKNMRERLLQLIGKDAYYVNIETFHSFCRQVIADYPEYFPLSRMSENLSDLEQYQLIEKLIDQHKPANLRPLNDPYSYVRDILKAISDLKREGVSVLQFEEILRDQQLALEELQTQSKSKGKIQKASHNLAKNKDLLLLYQQYQAYLQAEQRFDYDDMINFVVDAFQKNELLLREYQENLHYFLVDEYQDTNTAQNKLLNLLAAYWEEQGSEADVFVVGDPNQAIYRFQGASIENVLAFTRSYPQATVITLDTAYRCPQIIYDVASELIHYNQLEKVELPNKALNLQIRLHSTHQQVSPIQCFAGINQLVETVFLAEKIKKLIKNGVNPCDIAILYRNNSDVSDLLLTLTKWQIPYQLLRGEDILQIAEIQQLITLLTVLDQIEQGQEPDQLYEVMNYEWLALDSLTVMQCVRASVQSKLSLVTLLNLSLPEVNQYLSGQVLNEQEWQKIQQFWQKIKFFLKKSHNQTFNAWFEQILSEDGFGFLPFLKQQENKFTLIHSLNALYDEIKSLLATNHQLSLHQFLATLLVYQTHGLAIKLNQLTPQTDAIFLSTVHSAKGMEWQHVFIMGFVDKKWGNQRSHNKISLPENILSNTDLSLKEKNEDERRLFYVALTRAKSCVYLTYPEKVEQNNFSQDKFPSIFLTELKEIQSKLARPIMVEETGESLAQNFDQYLVKLLSPAPVKKVAEQERQFLQSLVNNFSLSVTALNNYLRDPQLFLENNLLRVPRAKPLAMAFGTAIHTALERFYKIYQVQPQAATEDFLLDNFRTALQHEILNQEDLLDRLAHGEQILRNYYQQVLSQDQPQIYALEKNYNAGKRIMLGDIPLTGKIDRIDWVDKSQGLVKVIDYKTGHNQSVGEIEASSKTYQKDLSARELALPETLRGAYKRQLIFYKLLLDLDHSLNPRLQVHEATFAFIEPLTKENQKIVPRTFQITDEEVADLKQLIRQVVSEIRSLAFLEGNTLKRTL